MHQSVLDAFVAFSSPLEGVCKNAYLDVRGLVTVGIGCLVDPVVTALPLPWVLPDGSVAPAARIEAELNALKGQQDLKNYPALSDRVQAATTIRLTDEGVLAVAKSRLLQNEVILRRYFPGWDSFPADAQLACCSIAWAVGAGFPVIFGNFTKDANAGLWGDCVQSCGIRTDGNPGIVPRNAQNRLALSNAQIVADRGLDISVLHWPLSPLNDAAPTNPDNPHPAA